MKRLTTFIILIILLESGIVLGQTNDFTIGMFGVEYIEVDGLPPTTVTIKNNNSSNFNVLSEDGFNVVTQYTPHYWTSPQAMQNLIQLCGLNGLQIMTNSKDWYKANQNLLVPGSNHYNSQTGGHPDFDYYFDNVYNQPEYSGQIWGHQICEESTFFNGHNTTDQPPFGGWPPTNFVETEVPLQNVLEAYDHFEIKLDQNGITDQKMIVMEAQHGGTINSNLVYDSENNNPSSHYTAKHLLDNISGDAIFLEGSYVRTPGSAGSQNESNLTGDGPSTNHYLGTFESIDFAKTKVNSVHDVLWIDMESPNENELEHIHGYLSKPNASWLWSKAYTSIIHGVDGIWFWELSGSWLPGEKPSGWNTNPERFNRANYSNLYRNYIAHLSRELRYLANEGYLTVDQSNVLYTKTDKVDPNCIAPAVISYLSHPYYRLNERYGLRYTIRTNGDEVIMIVSNPVNRRCTVPLDFSEIANPIIQNAYAVEVLFSSATVGLDNLSATYKVDRDSDIDLAAGTMREPETYPFFANQELVLEFGPLDVHVLKFKSTPPVVNENGWEKVWSNDGTGSISYWEVQDFDDFYKGDFDGDGVEELFVVQTEGANTWMAVLEYVNGDWEWTWNNGGNNHCMLPYRDRFVVGDFDGDGKDELLGHDDGNGGWTTMFHFANNDWHWGWSDYGDHPMTSFTDNMVAGDYDGDGIDEIFGCDFVPSSGWTARFYFKNGDFHWGWSDYGENHAIRPLRHRIFSGDFDGDGKDELLGFNNSSSLFHFEGGDFQEGWSNSGTTSFGGWTSPVPSNDAILVGDIDTYDNKDELMFIQKGATAQYSTSMDLTSNQNDWNWNWAADESIPYIHDWSLSDNGGSNTKYLLVKAEANEPEYLMAFRRYGCSLAKYNISMYKSTPGSNKTLTNSFLDSKNSTSNQEFISTEWRIYPNPSNGVIHVNCTQVDTRAYLKVYDPMGRLIKTLSNVEQSIQVIDLSDFPAGLYMAILTNGKVVTSKTISNIK